MMRCTVLMALVLVLAACGGEEDVVDGPFVDGWQLSEQVCEEPATDVECFRMTLQIAGLAGERAASCRIYPLDNDGIALALDSSVPDLDPATANHEVVIIPPLSIDLGDAPAFEVELPVIDNENFWRWQVDCDPGAPG